jgi:hypothetical protein
MECLLCTSKKDGSFTSPCGHQFCGKCFLRLHVDACVNLGITYDFRNKSKCPFCRQALGYEEEDYIKIRKALKLQDDLEARTKTVYSRLKVAKNLLQSTTRWIGRMRKIQDKLRIDMILK